jgi:hypothetical protein
MLTPRAPTTALNAHAVRDTVLTNRLPATALLANADRLSVLAGVGLNPNTLGVHAPAFHPLTHNVIDQLLPRAASILLRLEQVFLRLWESPKVNPMLIAFALN